MLAQDYQNLVYGLKQIQSIYDDMLVMVKDECRIINEGSDLNLLLESGSRKLTCMQRIAQIDASLAELKAQWQATIPQPRRGADQVGQLLNGISIRLRDLLNQDSDNGQKLGKLAGKKSKRKLARSAQRVAAAYKESAGITT